jgi:hypothetical protein
LMKISVSTFSTRTIRHFQVIGSFVSRTPSVRSLVI